MALDFSPSLLIVVDKGCSVALIALFLLPNPEQVLETPDRIIGLTHEDVEEYSSVSICDILDSLSHF